MDKNGMTSPSSSSASVPTFMKQGSCELNSRLKTRKLLGVGETNDGEVHRSKLSQILGHSEQLYFKEPKGLRFWQLTSALLYSCLAVSELIQPGGLFSQQNGGIHRASEIGTDLLTQRLYAAALLSLSVLSWRSFLSVDRELLRTSLFVSAFYSLLHVTVFMVTWLLSSSSSSSSSMDKNTIMDVVFSLDMLQLIIAAGLFAVSLFFYRSASK